MRKAALAITFFLMVSNASAQIVDTIGAIGIQGELSRDAYRGVGQMQNALGLVNFQQDLATLLFDVQTKFMGRYDSLSKEIIQFSGFQGINWNIGSSDPNSFYLEFYDLDVATCMSCKNPSLGYRQIEINDGADCHGNDHVKITF